MKTEYIIFTLIILHVVGGFGYLFYKMYQKK